MTVLERAKYSFASIFSMAKRGLITVLFDSAKQPDKSLVELAMKCGTAFNCISFISKTIAQLEFTSKDSAIVGLLKKPNSFQTQFDFIHSIVWDLHWYGNAYVRIIKKGKRIDALIPFSASEVKVEINKMGQIVYQTNRWGTGRDPLPADEVIHFRDCPDSGPVSMSRTVAAIKKIRALIAIDDHISYVFQNGIDATYFITSESGVSNKDRNDVMDKIREDFTGEDAKKKGGILSLVKGMDIKRFPFVTPQDADLAKLAADKIREVASIYGCPPFLAGGTSDTKYNNVSARMSVLHRETIAPFLENMTQKFTLALGVDVKSNAEDLLKGDMTTQTKNNVAACGGPYKSVNEVRQREGLEKTNNPKDDEVRKSGSPAPMNNEDDDRSGEEPTDEGDLVDNPEEE